MSVVSGTENVQRAVACVLTAIVAVSLVAGSAAAQPATDAPGANCHGGVPGPVGEAHPNDGVSDPVGRIAYGVVTSFDPAFGPIASLYAVDPDGSDRVLLLDCDIIRPSWAPDGSRLAFTLGMTDGSWQIATMAPDGSDIRPVTSGPGIHEIPTWSPDGTWLAYDFSPSQDPNDAAFRTTLWRIGVDGSDAMLLGDPDTFDVEPRLSPDGTQVAFGRLLPEEGWALRPMIRDISTGEERQLTDVDRSFEHSEWSPDGRTILANTLDGEVEGIAPSIMAFDPSDPGAEPVVLLEGTSEAGGVKASYSPNGDSIVFTCFSSTPQPDDGLCMMDPDGSNITVIVDEPARSENHPAWGVSPPETR